MTPKAIDVSVITSLYSSATHLAGFLEQVEECLKMVEARGYSAETIIVSNAPDKRERHALQAAFDSPWWREHGQLIVVRRETLYASWNRGVRASAGNAITFWNVDDYRNPTAIVEGNEMIRRGVPVVRFPWLVVVERRLSRHETNRVIDIRDPESDGALDPQADFCLGPFFMFARPLFEAYGPFDEQFHIVGDFDWQLRVVPYAGLSWGQCWGGAFFADGTNLSSTGNQRLLVEQNVLFERYGIGREPWPLDPRAEKLSLSYRASESAKESVTSDWSYDRQWRRQRKWNRAYRRCRRFVGSPLRLAKRIRRGLR